MLPSQDADKEVLEVDREYLRTVTAVMALIIIFSFLLCDCKKGVMFKKILFWFSFQMWECDLCSNKYGKFT